MGLVGVCVGVVLNQMKIKLTQPQVEVGLSLAIWSVHKHHVAMRGRETVSQNRELKTNDRKLKAIPYFENSYQEVLNTELN